MQSLGASVVLPTLHWVRGPATVNGEWVVLDQARAERYAVAVVDVDGMCDALASIETLQDIVRFVRRFGLLTHGPEAPAVEELVADWWRARQTVRDVLAYYTHYREALAGSRDAMAELRAKVDVPARALLADAGYTEDAFVLQAVARWLVNAMNSALAGVPAAMDVAVRDTRNNRRGQFVWLPRPATLIEHIYTTIVRDMIAWKETRTCKTCGRWFPLVDQRQFWCSKQCSARVRQQRRQGKLRKAQAG